MASTVGPKLCWPNESGVLMKEDSSLLDWVFSLTPQLTFAFKSFPLVSLCLLVFFSSPSPPPSLLSSCFLPPFVPSSSLTCSLAPLLPPGLSLPSFPHLSSSLPPSLRHPPPPSSLHLFTPLPPSLPLSLPPSLIFSRLLARSLAPSWPLSPLPPPSPSPLPSSSTSPSGLV